MILTWQQIPSPIISEILASTSCDGVVLDTEHGAFNNSDIVSCIQAVTLSGKKCLVRLTEATTSATRICLDAGASGLIFSTVETHGQADGIMSVCHFPSQKKRGRRGMGLVRQNGWGQKGLKVENPIMIAQIETKKGVSNINQIASHQFDYYLVGPYDLTSSLGCEGDFQNPEYLSALSTITKAVGKHKMGVHIPSNVKSEIDKYNGYGLKALGMDTTLLIEAQVEAISNA